MANCAVLAGHVEVGNHAKIGAFNAVHQFCRVGAHAFIGAYTALPAGRPARSAGPRATRTPKTYGINTIGLKRNGILRRADRGAAEGLPAPRQSKLNTSQALERIAAELAGQPDVEELVQFIRTSERGFIK